MQEARDTTSQLPNTLRGPRTASKAPNGQTLKGATGFCGGNPVAIAASVAHSKEEKSNQNEFFPLGSHKVQPITKSKIEAGFMALFRGGSHISLEKIRLSRHVFFRQLGGFKQASIRLPLLLSISHCCKHISNNDL